jgi:predicted DNA-binding transcriptional regulator AlpA
MHLIAISGDADFALTESQAAELLGLSSRTLQAWRVRGVGPRYTKLGRSVRYPRRELVAFQKLHTVSSTADDLGANAAAYAEVCA